MPKVVCFETVVEDDGGCTCRRVYDPPHVVAAAGGTLVLELPAPAKATVNGIPVIDFQVLCQGDAVQIESAPGQGQTRYRVDRPLARVRAAEGESCRFTGLAITGEAVDCPCGMVYSLASARHLGRCLNPQCQLPLEDQEDPLPPEELL
jgi:hypothetical protein